MPKPIALCLERIEADAEARYVRCTARSGREAGLGLGPTGAILWCVEEAVACELWVSQDQRLMAFRRDGAPSVWLLRAGRRLELPVGRGVVVLHGDELELGDARFRIHVHGTTDEVHAPRLLRAAVAVAALGVAAASCRPDLETVASGGPGGDPSAAGTTSVAATGGATPIVGLGGVSVVQIAEPDVLPGYGGVAGAAGATAVIPIEVREEPPR